MTDPADPHGERAADALALLQRMRGRPLDAEGCRRLAAGAGTAPGLLRLAAHALSAQRDAAAVEGLLSLPASVPGVVEGLFHAMSSGVRRPRADGEPTAAMLAMDFPHGRSRGLQDVLTRARAAFGSQLETLSVGGKTVHRFALREGRGTLAGRVAAVAHDVPWLHAKLSRLQGSRLWLNGWRFDADGALKPAAQVHLVRGWLSWAASQTETRLR